MKSFFRKAMDDQADDFPSFDEFMKGMMRDIPKKSFSERLAIPGTHADRIVKLKAFVGADYVAAGTRFKVGDIVTPKATSYNHGNGFPCIVLEIPAEPLLFVPDDHSAAPQDNKAWGSRFDMRVAHMNRDGEVHAHWVESWTFRPWKTPAKKKAAKQ